MGTATHDGGYATTFARNQRVLEAISQSFVLAGLITSLSIGSCHEPRDVAWEVEEFIACSNLELAVLSQCVNLERLYIRKLAAACAPLLLQMVRACSRLRVFAAPWADTGDSYVAAFTTCEFMDILQSCTSLEVVSIHNGRSMQAPQRAPIPGNRIRCLVLDHIALSNQQLHILSEGVSSTLEVLELHQENRMVRLCDDWYSYDALCQALSRLQQLQHLHLEVIQERPYHVYLHATSATILAPLQKLRTVYITPDVFPFSGLAHLSSSQLQHFHIWASTTSFKYPSIDDAELETSVLAMLGKPDTCPKMLSIAHQFGKTPRSHHDHDDDAQAPTDVAVPLAEPNPELLAQLQDVCSAAAVDFTYSAHHLGR